MAMHTFMKDCNNMLTKALCLALSTGDVSAYTHSVQLDSIKGATSAKNMFGRIPPDDVERRRGSWMFTQKDSMKINTILSCPR